LKKPLSLIVIGLLSLSIVSGILPLNNPVFNPTRVSAEDTPSGHLNLLQYHQLEVPAETSSVSSDPRALTYSLNMKIESQTGSLNDVAVTITNPDGWSTDEVEPSPTEIGADYLYWDVGTLTEGDSYGWISWFIPERTYTESLGFSVSRTIDQTMIPEGVDSVLQTTTLTVYHSEADKQLWVGVEYSQDLVTVKLEHFSQNGNVFLSEGSIDWMLPSGHEADQTFWATFRVTRKPGVVGPIEVYPHSRTDSRATIEEQSLTAEAEIEVGTVSVATSNEVNWEIVYEDSKTLWFQGYEQAHANTAELNFLQNRGTSVEGFSLSNEPIPLYFHNNICVYNSKDPGEYPINELKITLDSTENRNYDGWHIWGERQAPDESSEDQYSTWDYNWWLWHSIPDDRDVQIGFGPADHPYIVEAPGFSSTRSVSPMTFTESTIQHVIVTVDFPETRSDEELLVRVLTIDPTKMQGNPYFDASIVEGSWNVEPVYYSEGITSWNIPMTAGQQVIKVDIKLTPYQSGYEYTFIPGINLHYSVGEGEMLDTPILASELTLQDVELHPDAGVIGDVTVQTADDVLWTRISKHYMITIDYDLIAEANILDEEPPSITIDSPRNDAAYPVSIDEKIIFTVTDNIDDQVDVTATLTDQNGVETNTYSGASLPKLSGIYTLKVSATDDAGNAAIEKANFVVYDPAAGFVTGGGWFNDKVHFTINVKYSDENELKGHFKLKDKESKFEISSDTFQWLVVDGANNAYLKGTYTDDGTLYTYLLKIVDGVDEEEKPDYITLKVWSETDPETYIKEYETELEGGNIQVHSKMEYINIGVTASDDGGLTRTTAMSSLASDDINDYCIKNNVPFRFIFHVLNNEASAQKALENTILFNELGINLIVGHPWSSQCEASLDYVNENNLLLLSPSSTAPRLAIPDNLYRLCTNDYVQGRVIVDLYKLRGVKAVVIYYIDDIWGQGLSDVIEELCQEEGIEVIFNKPYNTDFWDLRGDLEVCDSLLAGSGYDPNELAFQIISFSEAADILNEAAIGNYAVINSIDWYGSDGTAQNQNILDKAPFHASIVKLISPTIAPNWDDPGFKTLSERYYEKTGETLGFYRASQYDCQWVYAKSVIAAGSSETEAVRSAMEDLVQDYKGASGVITFDANGDREGADYDIWIYGRVDGEPIYIKFGHYDLETDTITLYEIPEEPEYVDIGMTASGDDAFDLTSAIARLASEDINQYCEENGYPYRFRFYVLNNKGSSDIALSNTLTFNEMGINLIVGHGWSSQCAACLDYVNENNMLLLSQSSTAPSLAIPDNLYRLCTNDYVQGKVIADLYELREVKAVAVLYRDDAWGRGLNDVISQECQSRGIEVLANIPYNPDGWDIASVLASIDDVLQSSGYSTDELAFQIFSFGEIADIINNAAWEDYSTLNDVEWYGADGAAKNQAALDNQPLLATSVKFYCTYIAPDWDDPDFIDLSNRYYQETGANLEFYRAAEYDCLWVYAKSVIAAGSVETEAVRSAMEALVQNYKGVSGISTFDVNGDRIGADYDIWGYGWENGEPAIRKYGFYDLASDTIIWFNLEEEPSELALLNPDMWSYTRYNLNDPEGTTEYEVACRVHVFDKDGLQDIEYVKVIAPNGQEILLQDDVEEWGFPPGDGEYFNHMTLESPATGEYLFEVKDKSGNTAQISYFYDGWALEYFDWVSPTWEEMIPSSDDLVFDWSIPISDIDAYVIGLWNETEDIMCTEVQEGPVQYSGPKLEQGKYYFDIYARTPRRGEVVAHGEFYIGENIVLYDPDIWTFISYDTSDPENTMEKWLMCRVRVFDVDGLQDVDYVRVIAPNGEVYNLRDDEWISDFPPGDGEYYNEMQLETPVSGTFIFEARDKTGNIVQRTRYYDEWALQPYDWVSPAVGSLVAGSDSLTFEWSTQLEGVREFTVILWDDEWQEIWSTQTLESPVVYDGPSLSKGRYHYSIVAETEKSAIVADTEFYIGGEIDLFDPVMWSSTSYQTDDPEGSTEYWLYFSVHVLDVDGPQDIASVKVIYPDGITEVTLNDEGGGEFYGFLSGDTPISGEFTFVASDISGQTSSVVYYFDEWLLDYFDWVSPQMNEVVPSSGELVFDGSYPVTDVDHYDVWIWNETRDEIWHSSSGTLPIVYDGPNLDLGHYWYCLYVEKWHASVCATTEFYINTAP